MIHQSGRTVMRRLQRIGDQLRGARADVVGENTGRTDGFDAPRRHHTNVDQAIDGMGRTDDLTLDNLKTALGVRE
jgi:hypothetical protein